MVMKLFARYAWACTRNAVRVDCRHKSDIAPHSPLVRRINANYLRSDLQHGATGPVRGFRDPTRNYDQFAALVDTRFTALLRSMGEWTPDHKEYRSFGVQSQADLQREEKLFRRVLAHCFNLASHSSSNNAKTRASNPLFWNLRNAFVRGDSSGLATELKYSFLSFILRSRFSKAIAASHQRLADLRFPYEWYPATRTMQRKVHLHVGPTNSGKTYNALKALESAKTGIYAGPLRLLAHEIYSRFRAKGRACALITGEEQRIPEDDDLYLSSCTVEMTPLNQVVDVAVIDEIQMLADDSRGWAWTQAFLGIQARELHLCGEERTVDLIKAMCARTGDVCTVHKYRRLNALKTMDESLQGSFDNLRKGDAVVAFSRLGLHALKAGIEETTGRRCAIVYGSLPPETRAQQAALFNDPNNDYDFLAASDAIGMGLNLEIKRVVFDSAAKFDGAQHRNLSVPEIKQIGGRAGRFRTAARDMKDAAQNAGSDTPLSVSPAFDASPRAKAAASSDNVGFVTTLEDADLDTVQEAFEVEAPPIKTAGIQPPAFIIERFASYFPPETPFSFILLRLRELAKMSSRFHLCNIEELVQVADVIQPYPMSIADRCTLLASPVSLQDYKQREVLQGVAKCISQMNNGHLLDIEEIDLEILEVGRAAAKGWPAGEYLRRLEALHKAITLYLWLSYRYSGVFPSQRLAFHVKALVEEKITEYLDNLSYVPERQRKQREHRRLLAEKHQRKEEQLLEEQAVNESDGEPLPDEAKTSTFQPESPVAGVIATVEEDQAGEQERCV